MAHEKGASWFIRLGLVIAVISIVVFVLTRDFITTGTIIFAGVVFGIFASRKPRVLNYQIDNAGIHIESKTYDFQAFKSFAVHEEGALHFLSFMPMKRFSPGLTVYFPPEEEPKVVNALSEFLPIAQAKEDAIDRFMRKIRF